MASPSFIQIIPVVLLRFINSAIASLLIKCVIELEPGVLFALFCKLFTNFDLRFEA